MVWVEIKDTECETCGKVCKTIAGLKRHTAAKHPAENHENIPKKAKAPSFVVLTPVLLKSLTESAVERISSSAVFPKQIQTELTVYQLSEPDASSPQFKILGDLFKSFEQKNDVEKFYTNFYASVPIKSRDFFPGLTSAAATLLATKLADKMLVHCKEQISEQTQTPSKDLCERERGGLQYIGGYVLHNLHNKYRNGKNWRSTQSQHSMAILRACKAEDADVADNRLVTCMNRGGLWAIRNEIETVFLITENNFRAGKPMSGIKNLNHQNMVSRAIKDDCLKTSFSSIVSEIDICPSSGLVKDLLYCIVALYVRVRCFSYARDIIQQYKLKSRQVKSKGLRAEIKRQSDNNTSSKAMEK
eukprot:Seg1221.17 transcript_id=Seg1221.17/GoldUCD/mRNA.D3Y31 product="hypothetical protein" protein_id=Seg1221.17/GoldUCD/D3Y31